VKPAGTIHETETGPNNEQPRTSTPEMFSQKKSPVISEVLVDPRGGHSNSRRRSPGRLLLLRDDLLSLDEKILHRFSLWVDGLNFAALHRVAHSLFHQVRDVVLDLRQGDAD
jgi:hypothetical protein